MDKIFSIVPQLQDSMSQTVEPDCSFFLVVLLLRLPVSCYYNPNKSNTQHEKQRFQGQKSPPTLSFWNLQRYQITSIASLFVGVSWCFLLLKMAPRDSLDTCSLSSFDWHPARPVPWADGLAAWAPAGGNWVADIPCIWVTSWLVSCNSCIETQM